MELIDYLGLVYGKKVVMLIVKGFSQQVNISLGMQFSSMECMSFVVHTKHISQTYMVQVMMATHGMDF